jgi:hypothetical protein
MNFMLHFVEVEPEEHGAESQAVIAMKMADKNTIHARWWHICIDKLSLGPFAWIKE